MLSKNKLYKKLENARKAMIKAEFEKNFWQRKVKYYAPNRMELHYNELDAEWQQFCVKAMESEQQPDNLPK